MVECWCRRPSVGQTISAAGKSPNPQFRASINVDAFWNIFDPAVWAGGCLWYKVLYDADSFVYMAISFSAFKIFDDF